MEITEEQYQRIAHLFPKHRGNVRFSNLEVLNIVLYLTENGCKWRGLPEGDDKWSAIYQRWHRWNRRGVIQQVSQYLQEAGETWAEHSGAVNPAVEGVPAGLHPVRQAGLDVPGVRDLGLRP